MELEKEQKEKEKGNKKTNFLIKSNRIFDGVQKEPFAGAILVRDGKIASVGSEIPKQEDFQEPLTILEFGDQLVMPGFHDSHTHLLMAALYRTHVNLLNARSEEECARLVKEAAERGPNRAEGMEQAGQKETGLPGGWVIGFSWYHVFWDERVLPTKASLDLVLPDRPVFLLNAEGHGAWVNSKALEIAGVTKETPDPAGGYFARDEEGEPTGFLYETAIGVVSRYAFSFTEEETRALIVDYAEDALSKGITSVNDMMPYFHGLIGSVETYHRMDARGELPIRIHAATDLLGDLDQAEDWREQYRSDFLRFNLLKQFLDGVSTTHTALMLEEYVDEPGNVGFPLSDLAAIEAAVMEAHRRGFCVRLHSCGDRSARLALDYYERAISTHGRRENRHGIEHVEIIHDSDIPRFGELGVIPSVQPEHEALTQIFAENPYPMVLGWERANKTWPFKSLYDSAGLLAIGSDCPVVDNDPFLEIYRAVTRVHNDGEPKGGWAPEQKLTMYEVLRSYTYGSAYGVCREDELGTLEPGKLADLVVIDRDLFAIDPGEIRDAKVEMTMVGGEVKYRR